MQVQSACDLSITGACVPLCVHHAHVYTSECSSFQQGLGPSGAETLQVPPRLSYLMEKFQPSW